MIIHPDHIKEGKSTVEVVKQLMDKKPVLLYYTSGVPNSIIDIAVQKHRSQIRSSARPYGFYVKIYDRFSTLNTRLKYAERFRMEGLNNED